MLNLEALHLMETEEMHECGEYIIVQFIWNGLSIVERHYKDETTSRAYADRIISCPKCNLPLPIYMTPQKP